MVSSFGYSVALPVDISTGYGNYRSVKVQGLFSAHSNRVNNAIQTVRPPRITWITLPKLWNLDEMMHWVSHYSWNLHNDGCYFVITIPWNSGAWYTTDGAWLVNEPAITTTKIDLSTYYADPNLKI